MNPTEDRKAHLISRCEHQRERLLVDAAELTKEVQSYSRRAEHLAFISLAAAGAVFTLWLALRPRRTASGRSR